MSLKITFTDTNTGKVITENKLTPETYDPENEFDYKNWIFRTEVVR